MGPCLGPLIRNLVLTSAARSVVNKSSWPGNAGLTLRQRDLHTKSSADRRYFNFGNDLKNMSVKDVVQDLMQTCIELRRVVDAAKTEKEKSDIVLKHIKAYAEAESKASDFAKGLEWFNVSESLSIHKHLAGKIVVLDFFTYCCINCMHILPDLDALEKKFSVEDGLVVVGVHSAKFANERDSSKVLAAVQRYNVGHPVVNDGKLSLWRDIGIVCWPSLVMLGPKGQVLFVLVGEGHRDELFLYTKVALNYFKSQNQISVKPIPLKLAQHILPMNKSSLLFPGKIHAFKSSSMEKLVVSDTGNNRILVMGTDGKVENVVGGYSPGFKDGDFQTARFNAPQGVCVLGNDIFVADNENHAIRKINLETKTVETIAGTGFQGRDYFGGKIGKEQELSSPWDVAIYLHEQKDKTVPVLLIAIAGTHQIWALFLEDTTWWKNKEFKAGTCANIVGNGREANKNNSYPHSASLAQPSGLAVAQELKSVFFADSESSTVRRVCLDDGKVFPVCGADSNPSNLHCFGDEDGKKYAAKLQHPLGVAWNSHDRMIYIADTYNHKIKKTDSEGNCVTVCGHGKPSKDNAFDEPSGLAVSYDGKVLYIADTNNHCIKTLDLSNIKNINVIPIDLPAEAWNRGDYSFNFTSNVSSNEANLTVTFSPTFQGDLKLNAEAPQKWSLNLPSSDWKASEIDGDLSTPIAIEIPKGTEKKQMHIMLDIMTCRTSECIPKRLSIVYTIVRDLQAPSKVVEKKELNVR